MVVVVDEEEEEEEALARSRAVMLPAIVAADTMAAAYLAPVLRLAVLTCDNMLVSGTVRL